MEEGKYLDQIKVQKENIKDQKYLQEKENQEQDLYVWVEEVGAGPLYTKRRIRRRTMAQDKRSKSRTTVKEKKNLDQDNKYRIKRSRSRTTVQEKSSCE